MKVKLCGMKDIKAAQAAAEGADFLGFIMCDRFSRYIRPELVREIGQQVRSRQGKIPELVGVFVDQPLGEVMYLADYCRLDYIQLHGHENRAYAQHLRLLGYQVIKAFRYGEDFTVAEANSYPAEIILVDSYSKNTVGGTGVSFAWQQAATEIKRVQKPYIIAGGVKKENIKEAEEIFTPYGIDASSSLELDGQKDTRLIREFLQEAGKL